MNSEVREQWTAALRSGEYTQDNGFLRTIRGHCCLGVLCDLAVEAGVIPAPVRDHGGDNAYTYTYDAGSRYYLPVKVRDWAGLDEDNPQVAVLVTLDGETTTEDKYLAIVNDEGSTFSEIADLIDENL